MAFVGLLFLGLFIILFIIFLAGLTLFILGFILRGYYKKRELKKSAPLVLNITGSILMVPAICVITLIMVAGISKKNNNHNSIAYQVENGSAEDVERLLEEGVSPDCNADNYDENVIAQDGEHTLLASLAFNDYYPDHAEKMQLLIDYGADVNQTSHWCEYSPEEHMGKEYDSDIGYNDGCGETPLMQACQSGNYDAVCILLENGADVNATDYCGKTALVYAVHFTIRSDGEDTQVEIIKLLLEHGAAPDMRSRYSGTALEEAQERGNKKIEKLLLEY